MGRDVASLRIEIDAVDPPFAPHHGVLFGLQSKREVDDPVLASRTTRFETHVEMVRGDGPDPDFRGEYVNGKKGDRFLYLSWGLPDGSEPFVIFARAKIKLAAISSEFLLPAADRDIELICELQATNDKGEPASGTINDVCWRHPLRTGPRASRRPGRGGTARGPYRSSYRFGMLSG